MKRENFLPCSKDKRTELNTQGQNKNMKITTALDGNITFRRIAVMKAKASGEGDEEEKIEKKIWLKKNEENKIRKRTRKREVCEGLDR